MQMGHAKSPVPGSIEIQATRKRKPALGLSLSFRRPRPNRVFPFLSFPLIDPTNDHLFFFSLLIILLVL